MPPKKSKVESTVAKELKKKNADEAMAIVANLLTSQDVIPFDTLHKKPGAAVGTSVSKIRSSAEPMEMPPKKNKAEKVAEEPKRGAYKPQKASQEERSIKKAVRSQKSTNTVVSTALLTLESNLDGFDEAFGGVDLPRADIPLSEIGFESASSDRKQLKMTSKKTERENRSEAKRKCDDDFAEMEPTSKRVTRKAELSQAAPSSSLSGDSSSSGLVLNTTATTSSTGKPVRQYVYKIDCERVSKHVNVDDLKTFFEAELKIGGIKNNLGDNVSISCEDRKVVIKSKVFLPKRSLRYVSKKFLKKKPKIHVVSEDKHTYAFKYIGSS